MALDQENAATIEPSFVYDNGRRLVLGAAVAGSVLNNSAATVTVAPAGMRVKVLSAFAICTAFTSAGVVEIHDGLVGFPIGYISAVGNTVIVPPSGLMIFQTGVAFGANILFRGTGTFTCSMHYYLAP